MTATVSTASKPFISRSRSETIGLLLIVLLACASFGAGFLFGEDSSGGARRDFLNFHWKAIERFSQLPWSQAVVDYPSATNPLLYMLASLAPLDAHAYRVASTILSFLIFILLSVAYHLRFSGTRINWMWCVFAGGSLLVSPAFRSAAFWGDTDSLPFLFCAATSILLSWSENSSAARSRMSGFWFAISIAAVSAGAFYTRQFYAFVPAIAAWTLLKQGKLPPLVVLGTFAVAMLPELFLIRLWKGINPPAFHHQFSPSLGNVLLVGVNAALFSLPLILGSVRRSWREALPVWWEWRTTVAVFTGWVLVLVTLRNTAWPSMGGGIIVKVGLMMGPLATPFILSMSYLGLLAIMTFALRSWTNAVLAGSFFAPFLLASPIYERYFDPALVVAVLLFADKNTSGALFTRRMLICNFGLSVLLLTVGVVHYQLAHGAG